LGPVAEYNGFVGRRHALSLTKQAKALEIRWGGGLYLAKFCGGPYQVIIVVSATA
jgi:hypothetical protein